MPNAAISRGRRAILHFCETSSVKGVPKIVRSRTPAQRILWTFTVLLGAMAATYQVYRMMLIYLSYSTTISMVQVRDRIPFPDVTVCNLNVLWSQEGKDAVGPTFSFDQYVDMVLDEYNRFMDVDQYQAGYVMTLWSAVGYLQYFAKNNTRRLQRKMILDCFWDMDAWSNSHTPSCFDYVSSYFSHEHGPCFTFSLDPSTSKQANSFTTLLFLNDFSELAINGFPISSTLTYAKGIRVVVHSPGMLPDMSRGFNVAPGHETTVRMKGRRREMLGEPYGYCTERSRLLDCPFLKEANIAWNFSSKYQYSTHACENLCRQQLVVNQCACTDMETLALPEHREFYPSCGVLNTTNISMTIERLQCASVAFIEADDPGICECPDSCRSDDYELATQQVPWPHENFQLAFYHRYIKDSDKEEHRFSIYDDIMNMLEKNKSEAFRLLRSTDLIRRNYLQLNIVFETKETTHLKDKPAISPEALFGNLGGILNLWIGVTFITIIELFDLFFTLAYGTGETKPAQNKETTTTPEVQVPLNSFHNSFQNTYDNTYSNNHT